MAALWTLAALASAAADSSMYSAVVKELERSVREYSRPESLATVEAVVGRMIEGSRAETIFVINERVLAFKEFVEGGKRRRHAHMLLSVANLPSAAYAFNSRSTGTIEQGDGFAADAPMAVIAKKFGYEQPGFLVPNPFFADGDLEHWRRYWKDLDKAGRASPFDARSPRVFWRGNIGSHLDCDRDSGNYARFQAASLTVEDRDRFDVKCNRCHPANDTCYEYDATMRTLVKDMSSVCDTTWYEQRNYSQFRYLLNLPGTTYGGYSRNLNHLWLLGAIVLNWRASNVEYYYKALRHGATHLDVDKLDARTIISQLDANPELQAKLRAGAARVKNRIVCADCIAKYVRDALDRVASHFNLRLLLDRRDKLADFFQKHHVDCATELTELVTSTKGHASRVVEHRVLPTTLRNTSSHSSCPAFFDAIFASRRLSSFDASSRLDVPPAFSTSDRRSTTSSS